MGCSYKNLNLNIFLVIKLWDRIGMLSANSRELACGFKNPTRPDQEAETRRGGKGFP
jgi:hypothetical protein